MTKLPLMRERRKVPRFNFGKDGMIHPPGGGVGTKAIVHVISTQGCAVECEKAPGKRCELYFDSDFGQIGVEAQAVSKDPRGRIGLKFISVDKDTSKRLSDLCATLQIQTTSPAGHEEVQTAPPARVVQPEQKSPSSASAPWAPPKPAEAPAKERERRRVPRYISELRASVSDASAEVISEVGLITLSVLGCCLEGQMLPDPPLNCEVTADWEGRMLRLPGEVIWRKNRLAGIRFASLEEETDRLLRQVCATLRLQPLAPLPSEPQ